MKFFCLILTFFVLSLSAKPCCSDNDCVSDALIKKEHANKSSKEKECPGCSPFFTCGTCAGFIVTKPLLISLPLVADNQVKGCTFYLQPDIEEICFSIWQPPQLG